MRHVAKANHASARARAVAASYNRRWVITRFAQRAFSATKEEINMGINGS